MKVSQHDESGSLEGAGASNGAGVGLVGRIRVVSRDLTASLRGVLELSSCQTLAAPLVARTFGVNRIFAHKLTSALRKSDPLEAMHSMPGPEPLRKLLASAGGRGVAEEPLIKAELAVAAFEALIREEGGDRSGLDSIISSWLPVTRARLDAVAKQSAYRGMRQLIGMAADVVVTTVLVHPSKTDEDRADCALLSGYVGLRCVRHGARFKADFQSSATAAGAEPMTLEGREVSTDGRGMLLSEFCSESPASFRVWESGGSVYYVLDWGDSIGMSSARDVVFSELRRGCLARRLTDGAPRRYVYVNQKAGAPTKAHVYDLIVHKDLYPNREPELRVVKNGMSGGPRVDEQNIDLDALDVRESVELLGTDFNRFGVEGMERYVELLRYACGKLGWAADEFRGYRTRVEYPIFGTHLQMRLRLPEQGNGGV